MYARGRWPTVIIPARNTVVNGLSHPPSLSKLNLVGSLSRGPGLPGAWCHRSTRVGRRRDALLLSLHDLLSTSSHLQPSLAPPIPLIVAVDIPEALLGPHHLSPYPSK